MTSLAPAAAGSPALRPLASLARAVRAWRADRARAHAAAVLSHLDDHILRDIGLGRDGFDRLPRAR